MVALTLPAANVIEDYDGLVAFVTDHLQMDAETVAQIPAFIRLAEYRIERLMTVPERETVATIVTVAGQDNVSLPSGFRQLRHARIVASDGYPLAPATLNVIRSAFADQTAKPQVYAIADASIYFGPTPDAVYSVELTYIENIPALTSTNPTNWLIERHADAYVYGVLSQAEAFLGNSDKAAFWNDALGSVIEEANRQGTRYRNAAPIRLRSPVIV